jgi:putative redox protein
MTHANSWIGRDRYATRIDFGERSLIADEPAARGGGDAGPAPYELLLASLGACTAITLRMYADRKEWPLATLAVDLRLHGQGETLRIERILRPEGVDEAQAARLVEIAARTPVTLTLSGGVPIDTRLG